jgi:hypothetical protein
MYRAIISSKFYLHRFACIGVAMTPSTMAGVDGLPSEGDLVNRVDESNNKLEVLPSQVRLHRSANDALDDGVDGLPSEGDLVNRVYERELIEHSLLLEDEVCLLVQVQVRVPCSFCWPLTVEQRLLDLLPSNFARLLVSDVDMVRIDAYFFAVVVEEGTIVVGTFAGKGYIFTCDEIMTPRFIDLLYFSTPVSRN